MPAPEQRHRRVLALVQRADGRFDDRGPAQALVRPGMTRLDRQRLVQQQNSLLMPGAEIRVGCRGNAQIVVQLLVDIGQRPGQRTHRSLGGEGQAVGMARGRIRILSDEHDAHLRARNAKCAQHHVRFREDLLSGGAASCQFSGDLPELAIEWQQHRDPVLGDESALRHGSGAVVEGEILRLVAGDRYRLRVAEQGGLQVVHGIHSAGIMAWLCPRARRSTGELVRISVVCPPLAEQNAGPRPDFAG